MAGEGRGGGGHGAAVGRGRGGGGRGRGGGRNNTGGRGRGRGGGVAPGGFQQAQPQRAAPKPAPQMEHFEDDDDDWEQVNKHRAARVAPSQTRCAAAASLSRDFNMLAAAAAQRAAPAAQRAAADPARWLCSGIRFQYLGDLMAMGYVVRAQPSAVQHSPRRYRETSHSPHHVHFLTQLARALLGCTGGTGETRSEQGWRRD